MALSDQELEAKIQALEQEKRERQAALARRTEHVEDLKAYKAMLEKLVRQKESLERQRLIRRRSQD